MSERRYIELLISKVFVVVLRMIPTPYGDFNGLIICPIFIEKIYNMISLHRGNKKWGSLGLILNLKGSQFYVYLL